MDAAKKPVLLAVALFLCAVAPLAGQASADIFGVVQMKDGALLPGVHVTATSLSLAGTAIEVTDDNGSFRLSSLAPGVYKLTFVLEGFKTVVRERVPLGLGQSVNLKVVMKRGKRKAIGALSGIPARIAVKETASGKTLTREVFQTLPKGRNFDSLVTLLPGAANESLLLGGTSVEGASGLENKYYIDGVDVTDIKDGSLSQGVVFDFVDEIQVNPCGCPAESGGSLGGVINVITRSGSNTFHGEVIGYFSGSPLRAKYRDILALDYEDDSKAVYYPYETYIGVDDDRKYEAGLSLGGYILKDKLWFFASIMPSYYTISRTQTGSFFGYSYVKQWKRTENQMDFSAKLTSRPFKNLSLSAGVVNNFFKYKGDLSQAETRWISPDDLGFSFPNLSGSFSADLIAGNHSMASVRIGYFRTNQNRQLYQPENAPYFRHSTEAPGGYYGTTPAVFPDIPWQYIPPTPTPYSGLGYSFVMERNIAEKLGFSLALSYFLDLGGEHSWKAGVQFVRRGQNYNNSVSFPIVFLAWDRSYQAYGKDYGRGKYGYYAVRGNDVTGPYGDYYKAYGNMLALYIQDSWTIADRLTLNIGVRAGSENIPFYTDDPAYANLDALRFGLGDKLAPRLGFVWDVKGDSSLKVFGSWGTYHDDIKLAMAAGLYGGFKWKSAIYALDTYEWDKIGVNDYYPGRLLLPDPYTINFRSSVLDSTDPDLKPMTQREISLGLEKRLGDDLALSLRFVNKHLLRAIENIGMPTPSGKTLYIANPGGDFIQAKIAEARTAGWMPENAPDCPKARRDYAALNITLDKRFSGNWLGGISYTWSRLSGNYSGLASSDTLDRNEPYNEGFFDLWYLAFDKKMEKIDGVMPGDRPHYIKVYGSYSFPFGISAGLVLHAMSGTPTSTEWLMDSPGYLPFNRGDLGRTPFFWFANLYAEYNLKLGRNNLNISVNVDNVFNTGTAQRIYQIYNNGGTAPDYETIANTSDWEIAYIKLDPMFKKEMWFYGDGLHGTPLAARVGLKLSF